MKEFFKWLWLVLFKKLSFTLDLQELSSIQGNHLKPVYYIPDFYYIRKDGEDYNDFKKHRSERNARIKDYLRGGLVWDSSDKNTRYGTTQTL